MTDPHEIIEAALADAHDIGMTDALYSKAIVRALEAAGYRLLSAEGVTEEMVEALGWDMNSDGIADIDLIDVHSAIRAAILAAPLFGKGSEKPTPTPPHGKDER